MNTLQKIVQPESELQQQRQDNYVNHFESRQFVRQLDEQTIARMRNVCEVVRPAELNRWGADNYTDQEMDEIIRYANQANVQASLCLSWYLSDKGWEEFQRQWQTTCV